MTGGSSGATGPPDERLSRYGAVLGVYGACAGIASFVVARTGAGERLDTPLRWTEVAMTGVAAHKMSRLVTRSKVATPVRAAFTDVVEPGAPGEVNVAPAGDGVRRSIGELLACPFCLDVWAASALVAGGLLAPRAARAAVSVLGATAVADFLHFAYATSAAVAEQDR